MKKTTIFILVSLALCAGCKIMNSIKINKLMQGGYISNSSFRKELPFKFIKNFIIVQIKIGNKYEDFLFDTGAPTVIDVSLAKELKLKDIGSRKNFDSMGKSAQKSYTEIDMISISDINFNSIGAVIVDLSAMRKKVCTNIKGIIGYNLMNKAIWQIDYLNQKIILSDSMDSLEISNDKVVMNFYNKTSPKLRLATDSSYIDELIVDTGSSGGISVPMYKSIGLIDSLPFLKNYAVLTGVFSTNIDTSKMVRFPSLIVGQYLNTKNTNVTFRNHLREGLIGNKFLKDYIVILNWKKQEIILSSYKFSNRNNFNTFGFFPSYENEKLIISAILENSDAHFSGIQLYDQILQVNNNDYRNTKSINFCDLDIESIENKSDTLYLVTKRNNKEMNYHLRKKDLSKFLSKTQK